MSDMHNDDNTKDAEKELQRFLKPAAQTPTPQEPRPARRGTRVELLRGDQAGLADLLGALFGMGQPGAVKAPIKDADKDEADHPLLKALRGRKAAPTGPVPSSKAEVMMFLSGIEKFKVGDIVKLRKDFKALDRWPTVDQECIVTQILKTPYRAGEPGTVQIAAQLDIALMFSMSSDSEMDEAFGIDEPGFAAAEFLYDSRRFTKIGSIFE